MTRVGEVGGVAAAKTRLFLVRHGATTLTAEDRFAGATDVLLSDGGRAQAAALSQRLAAEPLAAAYASPMRRTLDTAHLIAEPHGIPVAPIDALREMSHGRWEGRTRADVERLFPEEYARWEADPFTFAPLEGECGLAVTARAIPAVLGIVQAHPGATVLVVSHKATIRLVISSLLGFDPRTYRDRLDQSPACLNVLDFSGPARARLTLFNDVSHYAATPHLPTGHLSPWWA